MIKAEMIAMLCFCLACFLDMADMLITAGLAVNGVTAAESSASPERNTFICKSLLFTLSFWVQIDALRSTSTCLYDFGPSLQTD